MFILTILSFNRIHFSNMVIFPTQVIALFRQSLCTFNSNFGHCQCLSRNDKTKFILINLKYICTNIPKVMSSLLNATLGAFKIKLTFLLMQPKNILLHSFEGLLILRLS